MEDYINKIWESGASPDIKKIEEVLEKLDNGSICVVEKNNDNWHVHQWIKKAILLYFKCKTSAIMHEKFYDKVPLKTDNWADSDFAKSNIRFVPGSIVRFSAYIAPGVVVMPSFINVGAHIEAGTMIDSHSTIGSCAYIGKNCHISDGVTIAGVLEPLQANPVIIEDNCFIGARSVVSEGVIVRHHSVIACGVSLTQSTPIISLDGEVRYGEIPPYSVVIPGTRKISETLSTACAIIIKVIDTKTKGKTSINEILRI